MMLGIVRLTCRDQKLEAGTRDYTAATAFRHSLAASARKVRSVDRETRLKVEGVVNGGMHAEEALRIEPI
jgi:hypothetical protein